MTCPGLEKFGVLIGPIESRLKTEGHLFALSPNMHNENEFDISISTESVIASCGLYDEGYYCIAAQVGRDLICGDIRSFSIPRDED